MKEYEKLINLTIESVMINHNINSYNDFKGKFDEIDYDIKKLDIKVKMYQNYEVDAFFLDNIYIPVVVIDVIDNKSNKKIYTEEITPVKFNQRIRLIKLNTIEQ